jgi:hypothetical protein
VRDLYVCRWRGPTALGRRVPRAPRGAWPGGVRRRVRLVGRRRVSQAAPGDVPRSTRRGRLHAQSGCDDRQLREQTTCRRRGHWVCTCCAWPLRSHHQANAPHTRWRPRYARPSSATGGHDRSCGKRLLVVIWGVVDRHLQTRHGQVNLARKRSRWSQLARVRYPAGG